MSSYHAVLLNLVYVSAAGSAGDHRGSAGRQRKRKTSDYRSRDMTSFLFDSS